MVKYRLTSLKVNQGTRDFKMYNFIWFNQIEGADEATRNRVFELMDDALCKNMAPVNENVSLSILAPGVGSFEFKRRRHRGRLVYSVNNIKCTKEEYCSDLEYFGIRNELNSARNDWINLVQMPAPLLGNEIQIMLGFDFVDIMPRLNIPLQLAYRRLKGDGAVDAWLERIDGNGIAVRLRDAAGGEVDPMQETGPSLAIASLALLYAVNTCKGAWSLVVRNIDSLYDGNNTREMMDKLGCLCLFELQLVCTSSPQGVRGNSKMKVMVIQ